MLSGSIKYLTIDYKMSPKWAWLGSHDPF